MKDVILVEVLDGGKCPVRAHKTDAGFDLFATEDVVIANGDVVKHPLNIKLHLPKGTHAQITSKSGLGSKGLLVFAGIIDESYRGIPHVVCTNLKSDFPIRIEKGQKMAQMIMFPYHSDYEIKQIDKVNTDTDRGVGGFGSSGAF